MRASPSPGFAHWSCAGASGWTRGGQEAEAAISAAASGEGIVLKEDAAARVVRVGDLVVKRYPRRTRRPFLAVLAAARLEAVGVPVVRHIAALAEDRASWLVTEFIRSTGDPGPVAADRTAEVVRAMHRAGVWHRNLKAANLLYAASDGEVIVSDLDGARFGRWSLRAAAKDLAVLERSHRHLPAWARRRFFARYARDLPRGLRRRLLRRVLTTTRGARPRRILVVRLSSLGDVLHGVPAVRAIRRAYPKARVSWAVEAAFAPVAAASGAAHEVIAMTGRNRAHGLLRLASWARRRRFDLAVDLQGLARSAFITRTTGAPERVGWAGAREGATLAYTHAAALAAGTEHAVQRYMRIAQSAGAPWDGPPDSRIAAPDPAAARRAEAMLAAAGLRPGAFAVLVPGAGKPANRWPAERWTALAGLLRARTGLPSVLVGTSGDRIPLDGEAFDLTGRTDLADLAAVLARAAIVIGGDTGPMHLACALGTPALFLFGAADPARTGPIGPSGRVLWSRPPCAPCLARVCPLGHHACMKNLIVEHVVEEAARWAGR